MERYEDYYIAPERRGLGLLTLGYLSRTLGRNRAGKEAIYEGITDKRITFEELYLETNRLCNALLDLGLNKGDHVALISSDRYWVYYVYLLAKCGFVVVPINYRFIGREIQTQVDHSDAKVLIMGESFTDTAHEIRHELPKVEHYIVITENDKAPEDMLDMWELMAKASNKDPEERVGGVTPDDACFLLYTSGTTGVPKGAIHTHSSMIGHMMFGFTQPFNYNEESRKIWPLPLFHAGGLVPLLGVTLLAGGTSVLPGKIDPAQYWEIVEKEKVTHLIMPTALWAMLTTFYPDWEMTKAQRDFSSVKHILNASAAMPPVIVQQIMDLFPAATVDSGYHSTETSFTVTGSDMAVKPPLGAGIPFIGVEISIRDVDDTSKELPPGQVGLIFSRGPGGPVAYYKSKEESERCLLKDGWVTSEDAGYVDPETGYIVLSDRVKDVINTGGETVSSLEVEREIMKFPAVAECAVIGTPDPIFQERVTGIVTLRPGMKASPNEIMDFCKDKLSSHKRPRRIEIVEQTAIPRTAMGKILKKELRKQFEE